MALNRDEVWALAETQYSGADEGYETPAERLFGFLVDVADAYVAELEKEAAQDPAPFLGGTTPVECAILGLTENLHMRRDPTYR